jgi:PAS domain-containing protein
MKRLLGNCFDMSSYEAVGIYSWRLQTNRVFGASELWQIFDLGSKDGLPIEYLLDRMHCDDKARVAKSMHNAIVTGEPSTEQYRVVARDGSVRIISAVGQCLRDEDNQPEIYSGTVFLKRDDCRDLLPSLKQNCRVSMTRQ